MQFVFGLCINRKTRQVTLLVLAFACGLLQAQPGVMTNPPSVPSELTQDIIRIQIETARRADVSLRYKMQKSDQRGTVVRDVIDTPNGSVARLVLREGKPLTPEEDKAERVRLESILGSTSEARKKKKQEDTARKLTEELINAMPRAMLYSYHPGQPQLPNVKSPQLVIDYAPNPKFQPGSTAQGALTGLAGTLWIDRQDHHLVRMEGTLIRNTNFAWGLVARIFAGGKLEFEQKEYAPGRYAYSRLVMNLKVRELMVRTVDVKTNMEAKDFTQLSANTTMDQAIRLLLDTPQLQQQASR
jgi:hypothetical protein